MFTSLELTNNTIAILDHHTDFTLQLINTSRHQCYTPAFDNSPSPNSISC